jgi:sugar/nucleoside kinase (ribokinase family)
MPSGVGDVLAAIGDLVEDVVIRVDDPVNVASDTKAIIRRRRGGSAANVAAAVAGLGCQARFIGRVGGDSSGSALVAELAAVGVDTRFVRQSGRTGTIVVLVDPTGERTMLADRGASVELDQPEPEWLDDVTILHVPMYSLVVDPLATTARTLVGWAHDRDVDVSVDVSSVALIDEVGAAEMHAWLSELRPAILFANDDEARSLHITGPVAGAVTVVKRGAAPVVVHDRTERHEVPTEEIRRGSDTTGAGDAFAAGFLTASWRTDIVAACESGHRAAALVLGRAPR